MCGIAGLIHLARNLGPPELEAAVNGMSSAIAHRGPDAAGAWVDAACGLALGHRRLSVVDLSAAGVQPMTSHSGRFVTVFNGEIYNYAALRSALPQRLWRGHSDTEVLLEAIEVWGLTAALERASGMYAFALWDRQARTLTLVRDRLGEKPLYYGLIRDKLIFGSELKALTAAPGWSGEIDRSALDDYTRHGVIHAPRSIYTNVRKLPAASTLSIPLDEAARVLELLPQPYWVLQQGHAGAAIHASDLTATDQLEALLRQSVAGQMTADVPVGVFLSGGIDSSIIAALMQAQTAHPVKSFSIGFHEPGYNEAEYAKAVAAHLRTDHSELYVTSEQARAVIPQLPIMFDEPFGDSSQIPTLLVAKAARSRVTVSLSGDGGDELFGGYNRYFWAERYWASMNRMPRVLRRLGSAGVHALTPQVWDALWRVLPKRMQLAQAGDKLYKLAGLAQARSGHEAYQWLIAAHRERSSLVCGIGESEPQDPSLIWARQGRTLAENMMLADAKGYLPDDILVKVDRATMAVSLEARAPFLDHRVVEFAMGLPIGQKIRCGVGKWLLREVLYRHVPKALIDRPKMGFGVPIDAWLRGPLRDWAEDLLHPGRMAAEGYLEVAPIRRAWDQHQTGRRNFQHFLWNILMFQAWVREVRAK